MWTSYYHMIWPQFIVYVNSQLYAVNRATERTGRFHSNLGGIEIYHWVIWATELTYL